MPNNHYAHHCNSDTQRNDASETCNSLFEPSSCNVSYDKQSSTHLSLFATCQDHILRFGMHAVPVFVGRSSNAKRFQ